MKEEEKKPEEDRTAEIMFRIIAIGLCVLIVVLFVLLFLLPGIRPVLFTGLMVLGFMLNALAAAWHFTREEKIGWAYIAGAAVCTLFILNSYLKFL
jgi:hypothetical protein